MSLFYPASKNTENPILATKTQQKPQTQFLSDSVLEFLPTTKQYGSLGNATVISNGKLDDIPFDTNLIFPEPQLSTGITATGTPIFGITKQSLNITNGGSDHQKDDIYFIFNDDCSTPAYLIVTEIDSNGSITDFEMLRSGYNFTNNNNLKIIFRKKIGENRTPTPPSISFVQNKFCIQGVNITNGGSGYEVDVDNALRSRKIHFIKANTSSSFFAYSVVGPITTFNPPATIYNNKRPNIFNKNAPSKFIPNIGRPILSSGPSPYSQKFYPKIEKPTFQGLAPLAISKLPTVKNVNFFDIPDTSEQTYYISNHHTTTITPTTPTPTTNCEYVDPENTSDSVTYIDPKTLAGIGLLGATFDRTDLKEELIKMTKIFREIFESKTDQSLEALNYTIKRKILRLIATGQISPTWVSVSKPITLTPGAIDDIVKSLGGFPGFSYEEGYLEALLEQLETVRKSYSKTAAAKKFRDTYEVKRNKLRLKAAKKIADLSPKVQEIIDNTLKSADIDPKDLEKLCINVNTSKRKPYRPKKRRLPNSLKEYGALAAVLAAIAAALALQKFASGGEVELEETLLDTLEYIPPDPSEIAFGASELGNSEIQTEWFAVQELVNAYIIGQISEEEMQILVENNDYNDMVKRILNEKLGKNINDATWENLKEALNQEEDNFTQEQANSLMLEGIKELEDQLEELNALERLLDAEPGALDNLKNALEGLTEEECESFCDDTDSSLPYGTYNIPIRHHTDPSNPRRYYDKETDCLP